MKNRYSLALEAEAAITEKRLPTLDPSAIIAKPSINGKRLLLKDNLFDDALSIIHSDDKIIFSIFIREAKASVSFLASIDQAEALRDWLKARLK